MADEKPEGGPLSELGMVAVGFVILIILWFATDGPSKTDLRGLFLNPPPPIGSGNAYGPQLGTSTAPEQDYSQQYYDEYGDPYEYQYDDYQQYEQ